MSDSPHVVDSPAPQPRKRGRMAEALRACLRALAASKLNRAAALALAIGLGMVAYAEFADGADSMGRGGWTTALTSLSILAGYSAGFLIRRALKLVLALVGVAAGAIVILKLSGVELSLGDITRFLGAKAAELEDYVKSWLPSGAGGGTGLFFGLRRGRHDD